MSLSLRVRAALPPWLWTRTPLVGVSLDAAGLVALADLSCVAQRSALTGTASYLDILCLCPGMHRQQTAPELNGGEYPAAAALTSGYVFRVENQATAYFLQRVGHTGHLVHLRVTSAHRPLSTSLISLVLNGGIISATLTAVCLLCLMEDWWGLAILSLLMLARLLNVVVLRRRAHRGSQWKGIREPGVHGSLLILVSQDRWLRLSGSVNDLKAVTSGLWLQEMTLAEDSLTGFATLLVYLSAALASNAQQSGNIILLALLLLTPALLSLLNRQTRGLEMFGREISVVGKPIPYGRRLDLAMELIKETGREDWALQLGMIPASVLKQSGKAKASTAVGQINLKI